MWSFNSQAPDNKASGNGGTPASQVNQAICSHPGCTKPVFPGSNFCSRSHRDANILTGPTQGSTGFSSSRGTAHTRTSAPPFAAHTGTNTASSGNEIRFYNRGDPYYEFTNFADFPVFFNGRMYPTSEHLFQSLKFDDQHLAEIIRQQPTPRAAFEEARRFANQVRKGWNDNNINVKAMETVLLLKFTQHPHLQKLLLQTRGSELIENSPHDSFWGIGPDGLGKNQLGVALMKVRRMLEQYSS